MIVLLTALLVVNMKRNSFLIDLNIITLYFGADNFGKVRSETYEN